MATKRRQDGRWVLDTARTVVKRLRQEMQGTNLRLRMPERAYETGDTEGWTVRLGNLGKGQPMLEIWYDRLSGYIDRKLYAGFHSQEPEPLRNLVKQVSKSLWPVRKITGDETTGDDIFTFSEKLRREEFGVPILEEYITGETYFGIFDPTRPTKERINRHFCERATAFFLDVAQQGRTEESASPSSEVYPSFENRKIVAAHQRRERSGYLALQCKIRDKFECQVCRFRFEEHYGVLGRDFAEAHHRIPLSKQSGKVHTRLEDLITVCANCHRMLHRMEGKADDVEKLKRRVQRKKRL